MIKKAVKSQTLIYFSIPLKRLLLLATKNYEFIKNVGTVLTGDIIAQGIIFLFAPIIARLYLPEHFGISAFFFSLFTIIAQFSTLCYENATIITRYESTALSLMRLAVFILVTFTILLLSVIIVLNLNSIDLTWSKNLGVYLYFLPAAIFLNGIVNILMSWNTRIKRFKTISKSKISNSIINVISRIGYGAAMGSSTGSLIAGPLLGDLSQCIILFKKSKYGLQNIWAKSNLRNSLKLAKEYKEFPMYFMPNDFLAVFSKNLPILFLGTMFTPSIAGFYAMGNRLIVTPFNLIATSVRRVYIQKCSEMIKQKKQLSGSYLKITGFLLLITFILSAINFFFVEKIFCYFLGEKWCAAGKFAVMLTPWLFTRLLLPPSNVIFIVLRKQYLLFRYQVVGTIIRGSSLLFCYMISATPEHTVLSYSITCAVLQIGIIITAFYLTKNVKFDLFKPK